MLGHVRDRAETVRGYQVEHRTIKRSCQFKRDDRIFLSRRFFTTFIPPKTRLVRSRPLPEIPESGKFFRKKR